MKPRLLSFLFLWALGCRASAASTGADLTLLTEEYPPFNFSAGAKVTGIATDILREMLARSKLDATFQVMPWARAQWLALQTPGMCVYSAARNAKREHRYKWVGPLVADKMTLFARADSKITLQRLEDASRYTVGGYVGDAYSQHVEDAGVPIEKAMQHELNLRKLLLGRIDLWIAGGVNGRWLAKQRGVAQQIKPVLQFGTSSEGEMWLACHPATSSQLLDKLSAALKQIKADGVLEEIAAAYR